jgi:hypothetical protein
MSQENSSPCKSVQFSRFIKISFTYPGDEYDRSALEPAKLTYSEASELMQLRVDWKEQQQRMQQTQQDSDDEAMVPEMSVPSIQSGQSSTPVLSH